MYGTGMGTTGDAGMCETGACNKERREVMVVLRLETFPRGGGSIFLVRILSLL
jgi:hypothetical protein